MQEHTYEESMIVLRTAIGIRDHLRARWPEWVLSWLLFALGLRLLAPGNTFGSAASFHVMSTLATEDHWGMAMCLFSGFRIAALIVNGTFKPFARISPVIRTVFSVLSGFIWFVLSISFYVSSPTAWAYIFCIAMLIIDIINAVLAGGDLGESERRARNGGSR